MILAVVAFTTLPEIRLSLTKLRGNFTKIETIAVIYRGKQRTLSPNRCNLLHGSEVQVSCTGGKRRIAHRKA